MSLRRRGAAAGVAATLGAENTSGRAGPRKNRTAAFDPNEPISGLRQKKNRRATDCRTPCRRGASQIRPRDHRHRMRGTDIGMRTLCRVDVAFAGEALVCQQHRISGNTEMLGQLAGTGNITTRPQLAAADQEADLLADLLVKRAVASKIDLNWNLHCGWSTCRCWRRGMVGVLGGDEGQRRSREIGAPGLAPQHRCPSATGTVLFSFSGPFRRSGTTIPCDPV